MIFPTTIIAGHHQQAIDLEIEKIFLLAGNSLSQNNPDIFIINENSGYLIETAHLLINFLSFRPYQHSSKIAIIYQADKLSTEAQSVLLKTLEEPGENNYIILTTANHQSLLPTIISRSHLITVTNKEEQSTTNLIHISTDINTNINTVNQILSEYSKDNISKWLEQQLYFFQKQLISNTNQPTATLVKKIIKAKEMINSHVEPRSVLDYIFLT